MLFRSLRSRLYRPVRFYVAVQNDGTAAEAMNVQGGDLGTGYTVRYFMGASLRDGVEVTDDAKAGTLSTGTLAPGSITSDATMLRVEIAASTNAVRGVTNSIPITVTSDADPSKSDTVWATVVVP